MTQSEFETRPSSGMGVGRDVIEGWNAQIRHLQKQANCGDVASMGKVGSVLYHVKKSNSDAESRKRREEAIAWWRKGADAGDEWSKYELSFLFTSHEDTSTASRNKNLLVDIPSRANAVIDNFARSTDSGSVKYPSSATSMPAISSASSTNSTHTVSFKNSTDYAGTRALIIASHTMANAESTQSMSSVGSQGDSALSKMDTPSTKQILNEEGERENSAATTISTSGEPQALRSAPQSQQREVKTQQEGAMTSEQQQQREIQPPKNDHGDENDENSPEHIVAAILTSSSSLRGSSSPTQSSNTSQNQRNVSTVNEPPRPYMVKQEYQYQDSHNRQPPQQPQHAQPQQYNSSQLQQRQPQSHSSDMPSSSYNYGSVPYVNNNHVSYPSISSTQQQPPPQQQQYPTQSSSSSSDVASNPRYQSDMQDFMRIHESLMETQRYSLLPGEMPLHVRTLLSRIESHAHLQYSQHRHQLPPPPTVINAAPGSYHSPWQAHDRAYVYSGPPGPHMYPAYPSQHQQYPSMHPQQQPLHYQQQHQSQPQFTQQQQLQHQEGTAPASGGAQMSAKRPRAATVGECSVESTPQHTPRRSSASDIYNAQSSEEAAAKHRKRQVQRPLKIHSCMFDGCMFRAKQNSNLREHLAEVHGIGTVFYPCPHKNCQYRAKRSGNLKRHLADVHDEGVVWRSCTYPGCGYKCKQRSNLKQHMSKMHNVAL